jgi:NAD dependent epimerase/dehydratase family enzyme
MAVEVLGSQRVEPRVLQEKGFVFRHPGLADIVAEGL